MTDTINRQELIAVINNRIAEINILEEAMGGWRKRTDGMLVGSKDTLEDILEYIESQ